MVRIPRFTPPCTDGNNPNSGGTEKLSIVFIHLVRILSGTSAAGERGRIVAQKITVHSGHGLRK